MKNFIIAAFLMFVGVAQASQELTIYSSYDATRLGPIFKPFTERTGIAVNIISAGSNELIEKLRAEGAETPADLYLDKDLVYLSKAKDMALLQPFSSPIVNAIVPAHLKDNQNNWSLIFYRARILVYNPAKVNPVELSTYEDLADSRWKGRLCLRTSANSYNEALGAYIVNHNGAANAYNVFAGWAANLNGEPLKGDRDVIHAVAAGSCDVGIANSYYLAPLVKENPNFQAKPFFPNQALAGTHVNGVGIGITKYSKKTQAANLVMEYLTSKEVQEIVAAGFSQYPVNAQAGWEDTLVKFGPFLQDATNLSVIAPHIDEAKELMVKAGYK